MLTRFDSPAFMENAEIDKIYEGMLVLVRKRNKTDLIFDGGYVIAIADDTVENEDKLHDILDRELDFAGYIHYGYIDKGENLDVVYLAAE